MNNINKGNEIRLCSIEQHHTTYWFIIIIIAYCIFHKVDYKPRVDVADKKIINARKMIKRFLWLYIDIGRQKNKKIIIIANVKYKNVF